MPGTLRVGVVGVGQRGLSHVSALTQLQKQEVVQLAALCDPWADNLDEAKVKKAAPGYSQRGVKLFSSVDELIKSKAVDALWFVMPPNQHKGEIVRAAQAGIAVMAEKPQSLFLDEVIEMADAIDQAGVPSTVGFQMRYDPWYVRLREYLADKWTVSMTMAVESDVAFHGRKHTHTEERGGPANRVWTANRAWSGTTMVEAGIHQTDLMRYWTDDDVKWVQSAYVERPQELWAAEGDNPVAYTVTYGFKKGGVGNIIFTRPARVYFSGRFDYVLSLHALVKFEDDLVAYSYEGKAYPPAQRPEPTSLRKVLARGPHADAMAEHNTLALGKAFAESILLRKPEMAKATFRSGLNSLAAVLAAGVSHERGGERIDIEAFSGSEKYARYRRRPALD
jgi:predicted dehydrogenase